MVSVDLVQLLRVCVTGVLAAQRYIAVDLMKLHLFKAVKPNVYMTELDQHMRERLLAQLFGLLTVDVKKQLKHKEGDTVNDLVTTADIVSQAVLERFLRLTFPNEPFTIVGEEDGAVTVSHEREAANCVEKYFNANCTIPLEAELMAHTSAEKSIVSARTNEELRQRVGVFIDPIDATNCFVDGSWDAPLTLVGITLDGVPVAGVVNRIFCTCTADYTQEHYVGGRDKFNHVDAAGHVPDIVHRSLSYVWNDAAAGPFIVHEGRRVTPLLTETPRTASTPLRVVRSGTTRDVYFERYLQKLQPVDARMARGAGNKLMLLFNSMIEGHPTASSPNTSYASLGCDVFIAPPNSVSKWDTCAPHAFMLALGGEIYTLSGERTRYSLTGRDVERRVGSEDDDIRDLPNGVVAATRWSKTEVERRMFWKSTAK
ncbi:putative inositol polyphosphate 1-phosphatase [Trypanosoma vivax]|uniref:3'(2'),5'-bisphosphate nucleotidase n=1 Tax=Trypanosoma vivax (strain Y486) TaxID=1055687 RepID=G0TZN1_TRYVY|nr:putative inositol polyphosphate 1-phosphatase [Trypanosoma vivax]CCC50059.1 putative inositol polyphosphate 1-phosphatase [Trypanosoma vivax Y486]